MSRILILLSAILVFAISHTLLAAPVCGTSFTLQLHRDQFRLEYTQTFSPDLSLREVVNGITDLSLIPKISKLITQMWTDKSGLRKNVYLLFTKARKTILALPIARTTVNSCEEWDLSDNLWKRNCILALDQEDTGELFRGGNSTTVCGRAEAAGAVVCKTLITGSAKPIRKLVFTRTASQLGLYGAIATLRDSATLAAVINHLMDASQAQDLFETSPFGILLRQIDEQAEKLFADGDHLADVFSSETLRRLNYPSSFETLIQDHTVVITGSPDGVTWNVLN